MNLKTKGGAVVATLAGAAAIVALSPAPSALAEPAGCSSSVTGSTSSTGLLIADGYGSCSGSLSRTLRVEIKQDIAWQPDPLLAANSDSHYGTGYHAHVTSCDHGQTAYYYGNAFFTVNTTYHETAHTLQHTCNY